jgi:hypothetical protein
MFVQLLAAAKWNRVDPDELRYGSGGREICVENGVRILYNDNTFKKNVDRQGNAMACHKGRDRVNDNEIVSTKAHVSHAYLDAFTSASFSIKGFHAHRMKRSATVSRHRGPNCPWVVHAKRHT